MEEALARHFKEEGLGARQALQSAKECIRTHQRRKREAAQGSDSDAGQERTRPRSIGSLSAFVEEEHGVHVIELDDYANDYEPKAEELVAATMYSMLNDKYYGQWAVLRTPFRRLQELWENSRDELSRVPQHYRYFALALLAAPEFWRCDQAVQEQMELEAFSKATT